MDAELKCWMAVTLMFWWLKKQISSKSIKYENLNFQNSKTENLNQDIHCWTTYKMKSLILDYRRDNMQQDLWTLRR